MKTRIVLLPALATLLAGFLVAAPAAAQKTQDKAQDSHGQVKDAAASKAALGTPLLFSVAGLTKDNVDEVTQSLTSLTERVFVCPDCKHMDTTAGKCTSCNTELAAKREPILFKAMPALDKASIQLTPFAARTLSYSDLEGALKKNSIEIDDAKFPLAGESRLVLHGGVLADVSAIDKALTASGFFKSAKASYDDESNEIIVVVQALPTAPMYDKVAAAIEALDTNATLENVIWGPLPTPANI